MSFYISKFCIFLIFFLLPLYGKSSLNHSSQIRSSQNELDRGLNWFSNSNFNSIVNFTDSSNIKAIISKQNDSLVADFSFYKKFKENYYIFIQPNIYVENFLGSKRLFNGKLSLKIAGFGYKNNWLRIGFERGTENWGAGNNIQLALSQNSESFQFFSLRSDYGNIRVSYLHGFLESMKLDTINYFRNITARGVEWTDNKSFLIGLSETTIYSSAQDGFDFSYLNPLSSHLEIELNGRNQKNSNAVWQFHLDILLKEKLRFSSNFLIDEFVLDPDIELNKENGDANSFRISYIIFEEKNANFIIFSEYVKIGTPTFRHGSGSNNFVLNSRPLGFQNGSDLIKYKIGGLIKIKKRYSLLPSFSLVKIGEENLYLNPYKPYKDYIKGHFPSGSNYTNRSFNFTFEYIYSKNLIIECFLGYETGILRKSNFRIGFIKNYNL